MNTLINYGTCMKGTIKIDGKNAYFVIWEIFTVYFCDYVKTQHMHCNLNLKYTHIYHVIYYIT